MANLSNINDKFLVTTGGNVLIGQTAAVGSSIFQVTGNSTFAGTGSFANNLDATKSQNTATSITVSNINAGSSQQARFVAIADSGNIQIKAISTANTTYGVGDVGVINCDTMSNGLKFAHNDQVKYTLAFNGENTWTGGGTFGGGVYAPSFYSGNIAIAANAINNGASTLYIQYYNPENSVNFNNGKVVFTSAGVGTFASSLVTLGSVGIGVIPSRKLHIASAGDSNIRMENTGTAITSGDNYGQIEWEGNDYNTGANGIRASIQVKAYGAGTQGETGMYFRTSYIGADSNQDRMVINHLGDVNIKSGNLSIGQSSENNISNTTGETWIGSNGLRYNSGSGTFARSSATAQAAMMILTTTADVEFYTQASTSSTGTYALTPKMVIKGATSNVGIGTATPGQKLEVVGNIEVQNTNKIGFRYSAGDANMYEHISVVGQALNLVGGTSGSAASTEAVRITTQQGVKMSVLNSGNVGIGTSSPDAKLHVDDTAKDKKTMIRGNNNSQGFAQNITLVNQYPVVSAGTQLIIPFTSQGNLNSNTIIKIMGHSARFNASAPSGFTATIALGHLNALYSLAVLDSTGNISGVSTSGMNLIISFTSAYTYAVSDGIFATIEYMTNATGYSLQPANIVMN